MVEENATFTKQEVVALLRQRGFPQDEIDEAIGEFSLQEVALSARRAIFFAKYEASQRNTDEVTHHITVDDLLWA
jgi:hypothetical protein